MPSQHQRWRIYFCPRCDQAQPDPKDKYVVVVHADEIILGVFINSRSSEWLRKRDLAICEVPILAAEHPVLRYDSVIDCHTVYEFYAYELTEDKGEASPNARSGILIAIRDCPTIPRKHKKAILERERIPFDDEDNSV